METSRISELLHPFLADRGSPSSLSPEQLNSISMYIDILLRWNARVNLTSIRQPEAIVTRHFGESLFAARHLFPEPGSPASLIDLGSGAGFPGVPIKLWKPVDRRDVHGFFLAHSGNAKAISTPEIVRPCSQPILI